jgi:ABC-type branched-subunit amino acid transport system ATPase component/sugar phosphate permease
LSRQTNGQLPGSGGATPKDPIDDPAAMAAVLLRDGTGRGQREEAELVLPDDLLPGVGATPLSLRQSLREGGWATIAVVVLISIVTQFSRQATSVLGPDLEHTFRISDKTLIGLASFGGVALVLGAVPAAWLADRISRKRIVVVSGALGTLALVLAAVAPNAFVMFWALAAVGLFTAYEIPVFSSLLSDQYPIQGRSRVFAIYNLAIPIGLAIGPFVAGSATSLAGGSNGWRWAFLAAALPTAVMAGLAALLLREPPRGRYEQETVLGGLLERHTSGQELPITISTAYQRMKKIKTFYYVSVGLGVLGFALITVPIELGLLLKDHYHYAPFTRGWLLASGQIPSIALLLGVGYVYDRTFRTRPERVVQMAGWFIIASGPLLVIGLLFQPIVLVIGFYAAATACTSAALLAIGPVVAAVAPYRLRSQAFAIVPVFVFLMGGFFGGLIAGVISDAHGPRVAMFAIAPLASVIGGWLYLYGSRFLRRDISLSVEELLEEQAEQRRMSAEPDRIPMLQVRNLDFSYGPVQVLFDIDIEVTRGETLALLGTNGAGKSTLLRAISGLGIPDRGVIRLDGQSLTHVETEVRFAAGVVQLRGGAGVFPDLTVTENLKAALLSRRLPSADQSHRIARSWELFPELDSRRDLEARSLSGGQQQMLALAMALMHDPKLLLIDELSLGLAPLVVRDLLAVVERLKADGLTMIIVEQSLNVALSFADRAVFMEKGRIRFEGRARDLLERDDLARAVFLGGTGG